MPHAVDDVADQHVAVCHVRLVDHPILAAAVAGDAQEPRRERAQRLVEGFRAGRQRVVAVAAPVPSGDRPGRHQASRGRIKMAIPRYQRFSAGAAVNTPNIDTPAAFRGGVMLIAAQIVAKVL